MYRKRLLAYSLFIALQIITGLLFLFDTTSGTRAALDGVPLDDTWIHFVYARNLAQQGGFYYNPGVPEAGATSPLWVILLSIPLKMLMPLGVGPVVISKALAIAFAILASMLAYHLVEIYTESYLAGLLAGTIVALDPTFSFSKVSGMEATLFASLMLLTILLFTWKRFLTAGIALGLTILARPEGYILIGILATALLLWSVMGEERKKARSLGRKMARLLVPAALIVLPVALFYFSVNGSPFPNTFHAKHRDLGFFNYDNLRAVWTGYLRGLAYFSHSAWLITLPLLLVGTIVSLKKEGRFALPLVIFPWALYYSLSVIQPLLDARWNFAGRRYLDSTIPFLIILITIALWKIWSSARDWLRRGLPQHRFKPWLTNLFAASLAVVIIAPPLKQGLSLWQFLPGEYSWNCRNVEDVNVRLGHWVSESLPPDSLIALGDAGAIRYFGQGTMIDLLGLNSHELLGRNQFEFMSERRVDYLIVFPNVSFDGWPYAEPIYEISIDHNTILGGSTMVVYETNWNPQITNKEGWYQIDAEAMELIDSLDVGDPADEVSHDYSITGEKPPFARMFKTTADVTLSDDGWAYTGEESFAVASIPRRDLIVAKRYDAVIRGRVRVYVDGIFVGEWEFPERQFQFGEDLFVVPASLVTNEQTRISFEFVPGSSIDINSFYYWIFVPRS